MFVEKFFIFEANSPRRPTFLFIRNCYSVSISCKCSSTSFQFKIMQSLLSCKQCFSVNVAILPVCTNCGATRIMRQYREWELCSCISKLDDLRKNMLYFLMSTYISRTTGYYISKGLTSWPKPPFQIRGLHVVKRVQRWI